MLSRSLAIPDGLVMDPLAPTALAVSSEFMDRIGSGLTILRDHGKKVQKVRTYMYTYKRFFYENERGRNYTAPPVTLFTSFLGFHTFFSYYKTETKENL